MATAPKKNYFADRVRKFKASPAPTTATPFVPSDSSAVTGKLAAPGSGWVLYLDSSTVRSASAVSAGAPVVQHCRQNASTVPSERVRRHGQRLALYDLVGKLPLLPTGHPMSVETEVASGALRVLDYLASFDDMPPTVFAHGGDAVVFKWDGDEVARYLTIGGHDVTLLDMRKADPSIKCEAEYDLDDAAQREELLRLVGGVPSAASALIDAT